VPQHFSVALRDRRQAVSTAPAGDAGGDGKDESLRGDFGQAKAADALKLIPSIQAESEKAKHPKVVPAAKLSDAAAFDEDVISESVTVQEGVDVSAADERPSSDEAETDDGFDEEEEELEGKEEQEEVLAVLEEDEQVIAVGVETFGIAGAQLGHGIASGGIDVGCAAMVEKSIGDDDGFMTGDPDTPGKVEFVGVHEEDLIELTQMEEEFTLNEVRTTFGHEDLPFNWKDCAACWKSERVKAGRATGL
jgi:hypothetical protein